MKRFILVASLLVSSLASQVAFCSEEPKQPETTTATPATPAEETAKPEATAPESN